MVSGDHTGVGEGLLVPIQKPGKPTGPAANLCPVVLLTTLCKVLYLIVLTRIQSKVNDFVSEAQSGFRSRRSTVDVVWSHQWCVAHCQKYQQSLHILGIDMSKAFDTISRCNLLTILEGLLNSDEVRMIRLLLTSTTLCTRIGKTLSEPFSTNIGTPQGDSLSAVLFIIYLGAALQDVQQHLPPRPTTGLYLGLPFNLAYADAIDFVSTDHNYLEKALPTVEERLGAWHLKVNSQRTELISAEALTV